MNMASLEGPKPPMTCQSDDFSCSLLNFHTSGGAFRITTNKEVLFLNGRQKHSRPGFKPVSVQVTSGAAYTPYGEMIPLAVNAEIDRGGSVCIFWMPVVTLPGFPGHMIPAHSEVTFQVSLQWTCCRRDAGAALSPMAVLPLEVSPMEVSEVSATEVSATRPLMTVRTHGGRSPV